VDGVGIFVAELVNNLLDAVVVVGRKGFSNYSFKSYILSAVMLACSGSTQWSLMQLERDLLQGSALPLIIELVRQ
jgi:hypothetical protein